MKILKHLPSLFIVLLVITAGCNKEDDEQIINTLSQTEKVNNWIYEEMDLWYLWTSELQGKPATTRYPADFYESILVDQDRFSFIYDDYQELIDRLNGVQLESGFEFKLYFEPDSEENVIILITYIKKGSPASDSGLKRGDALYRINGTQITETNYRGLLGELQSPYEASFRRYDFQNEAFVDQGMVQITPVEVAENPFLLDTVYEFSGKKIGYLVYTQFSNGPSEGSTVYIDEMDMIFGDFQSQGINEFILDLRFNGGGSEVAAKNLASLIVKATSEDLMFKKRYNSAAQDFFQNDERYGESFLNIQFEDKGQSIGNLIGSTVYVITSDRSASASELVINSFLPFMDVFIVGDTTVGKDVGSSTFRDIDNRDNDWAIQPIIVKTVNAENKDYPKGFFPDVPLRDNFLILQPLGDTNEPLLNAALSAIGVQNARKIDIHDIPRGRVLFESLDQKFDQGKLILERSPTLLP